MIIPKPTPGLPPPGWIVQIKWNGERAVIDTIRGGVSHSGAPFRLGAWARYLPRGIWDGEMVGGIYRPFDCLAIGNRDLREEPIEKRLLYLPQGITRLEDVLEVSRQHEGIVAKRPGSLYPKTATTKDWRKWRWVWGDLP